MQVLLVCAQNTPLLLVTLVTVCMCVYFLLCAMVLELRPVFVLVSFDRQHERAPRKQYVCWYAVPCTRQTLLAGQACCCTAGQAGSLPASLACGACGRSVACQGMMIIIGGPRCFCARVSDVLTVRFDHFVSPLCPYRLVLHTLLLTVCARPQFWLTGLSLVGCRARITLPLFLLIFAVQAH